MRVVDVKAPLFRMLFDLNAHTLEREVRRLGQSGWYPVGGVGQYGREWMQVMVKEMLETEA